MSHSLVEIPRNEWQTLCDLYSEHKKYASSYGVILNFINWIKKDPELEIKIYSLDGDWQKDGTFIIMDYSLQPAQSFFNTLSNNNERLYEALNCLDTSTRVLFFGFRECYLTVLEQYFVQLGFSFDGIYEGGTKWYHIEREKALAFDVEPPAGITLSSLTVKHALEVNSVWPHRADGSVKFVERLIKYNNSVGAFDKDGNLIAWCLRLPLGALGLLQVVETHKRKGLGSLIVRNMARLIALKNEEVMAPVVFENSASQAMFEKLGFKQIDKAFWAMRPAK